MTIKDNVLVRPQFTDDEATDALYTIAEKLKEIDRLFGASWERFPKDVKELIEKADPKNEMDPGYWSKQFNNVAEAVEEEAAQKYRSEQIANSETSPPLDTDLDSPQI